jgi:hypothetical protein
VMSGRRLATTEPNDFGPLENFAYQQEAGAAAIPIVESAVSCSGGQGGGRSGNGGGGDEAPEGKGPASLVCFVCGVPSMLNSYVGHVHKCCLTFAAIQAVGKTHP